MMKIIRVFANIFFIPIACAAIPTVTIAQEQTPRFYFSFSAGNVDYSDVGSEISALENEFAGIGLASDFDYDDSDTGFRLMGGFIVNPNVALTVSYVDLGQFSFDGFATDGINVINIDNGKIETNGLEFGALFSLKVPNSNFEPYARLALFRWDSDFDFTVSSPSLTTPPQTFSESDDGTDIVFGLGANYFIGKIGFGVSWDRYDLDGTDVDFLAASLVVKI
jgi:OOP family OmpA-OmpF porin